jgi:hypothetical protein
MNLVLEELKEINERNQKLIKSKDKKIQEHSLNLNEKKQDNKRLKAQIEDLQLDVIELKEDRDYLLRI